MINRDWLAVFESLSKVYTEDAFSNIAINEAVSHHGVLRESFVRTFAKGVLRDSIRLDCIIDCLADKGVRSIRIRPLIILRMGIFAIDCLDSVPDHAAVNEAVALAKRVAKGSDRFVNGMLRSFIRRRSEFAPDQMEAHIRYSFPKPVYDLLSEQYGDEAPEIAEALNTAPKLYLRVNTLRTGRDEVMEKLAEAGIEAKRSPDNTEAIEAYGSGIAAGDLYREGLITIQSLSSMIAVKAFAPASGSRVLDLCAAPGGKTGYMAEMMKNTGSITACDIYPHRLKLIRANLRRLGVSIAETIEKDASVFDASMENAYDYVLADVPCSGLGVIAGKPEIKLRTSPEEYPALTALQKKIIENAFAYTKPGGRLMYSTCTLNKEENENIAKHILSKTDGMARIIEMATVLPYNGKVGFFYSIIGKNAN